METVKILKLTGNGNITREQIPIKSETDTIYILEDNTLKRKRIGKNTVEHLRSPTTSFGAIMELYNAEVRYVADSFEKEAIKLLTGHAKKVLDYHQTQAGYADKVIANLERKQFNHIN